MEREYLFTIVVPVYNVEQYLEQCLDSLLYQTKRNHIVVMVNDGSTDSSGEIAKKYAEQYSDFFVYFEQENKGLGAARNSGFNLVKTKMVGFLDSDDWVPLTYIERLSERLEKEVDLPDIMYTHPVILDSANNEFREWNDFDIRGKVFPDKSTVTNVKLNPWIMGQEPSANIKVYRTSFLRECNFKFPEGTKWEDVEPHFKLLHLADRCIAEDSTGFIYRTNTGSQITSSVGYDRLQIVTVFSRILEKAGSEKWAAVEILFILRMLYSFSKWSISACTLEVRKELLNELHNLYGTIMKNYWQQYFSYFQIDKKDRLYIELIRSPFYKIMFDPIKIDAFFIFIKKVKRFLH